MPTRWPMIYATDLVMRSERWVRVREDLERYAALGGAGVGVMPWDSVVASCAYGAAAQQSWWQTNLLLPVTLHIVAPPTEGMPGTAGTPQGGSAPASQPRGQRRASRAPKSSKEICSNWNGRVGTCAGPGQCPSGRRHVCSRCSGHHRACDNLCGSTWGTGASSSGGRGGGGGGGKKGKGKGKHKDHHRGQNEQPKKDD